MRLYLKNLFSNTERHALEKQAMQDPFEAEAFEGLSELSAEAFEADIDKLQSQLNERTKKTKLMFWQKPYAIAASILLLIGLGVTMFMLNKADEPYQVVTNTQGVEDVVVINDADIEKAKENEDRELFEEPDYSSKEETIVAYEAIEEEVPVENKAKPVIEKPMLSKKMPYTPAKATIAAAEVFEEAEEQETKVFKEVEALSDIKASKMETAIATDVASEIETWSGTITDNYGMPLAGVSVIVKDSDIGTVTDFDGNYTIQVPKDAQLEANYIGFENTDIAYDSHEKVVMDEDQASLDEVVVVGYGTAKKRSVTSSVKKIKSSDLSKESAVRVDQALKGRVAGVNISDADVDSEEIITKSAIAPQGSDAAFKQWLMTQLDPSEFEKDKEYSVEINFVINEKGVLTDFKTNADLKNSEKRHLKNTLLSSPNWTPAQNNNGTTKQSKTIALWFHF